MLSIYWNKWHQQFIVNKYGYTRTWFWFGHKHPEFFQKPDFLSSRVCQRRNETEFYRRRKLADPKWVWAWPPAHTEPSLHQWRSDMSHLCRSLSGSAPLTSGWTPEVRRPTKCSSDQACLLSQEHCREVEPEPWVPAGPPRDRRDTKKTPKLPETPKTPEEMWQHSVIGDYLVKFRVSC